LPRPSACGFKKGKRLIFYLFAQTISLWFQRGEKANIAETVAAVTEVIENNTEALNRLENMIGVTLSRQEAKLDELVAYARREKGL